MKQISKIASFFIPPVLVLLAHLIASTLLNLYVIFPNVDIPFHFAGGFSVAYTSAQILSYLEREKITGALNKIVFLPFILSLTASATVLWEFAEFILDQLLHTNIQISLANTMQDQFMGISGGIAWALISYKRILDH